MRTAMQPPIMALRSTCAMERRMNAARSNKQMQLHGRRQLLAQPGQAGLDEIGHLHGVGTRLLAHGQHQPRDTVDPGAREALLHAVAHLGNVLDDTPAKRRRNAG